MSNLKEMCGEGKSCYGNREMVNYFHAVGGIRGARG